jgi:surfactin synthase thioesterase subunit
MLITNKFGWLNALAPHVEGARDIVAFPSAAANASNFTAWAEGAKNHYGIRGVSLPGRQRLFSQHPISEPADLTNGVLSEIDTRRAGQTVLFGHSCGAYFAMACAQAMQIAGWSGPAALVVAGAAPPRQSALQTLADMTDQDLMAYVTGFLGNGLSAEPGLADVPEFHDKLLMLLRADINLAIKLHDTLEPVALPIIALGGASDPSVRPAELSGWAAFSNADFQHYTLSGGHFFPDAAKGDFLSMMSSLALG